MPRISQFRGIDISMYYNDHAPPHFHAEHGDDEAVIDIMNLTVIDGSLPSKLLKLVLQWARQATSTGFARRLATCQST